MEQMFRQFLDQLQNNRNDTNTSSSSLVQGAHSPSEAIASNISLADVNTEPVIETHAHKEPAAPITNPHVSKIQQLLDAAEADAAGFGADASESQQQDPEQEIDQSANQLSHPCGPDEYREDQEADGRGRCYADGFGELDIDSHGQLRYVGLGSTASVAVENCIGLRRYITQGLEKKGYEMEETFFISPEATHSEETIDKPFKQSGRAPLPPPDLVELLISLYVNELAYLFPITTENEVRQGYQKLNTPGEWDHGHAAAFYAALAVAAPLLTADNVIFDHLDKKWVASGPSFYNQAMRFINMPFSGKKQRKERSQDIVTALGLLSMYLAETGSQAEAWISVGRAIRIAQDIGLHRSPERLRLPREVWNKRRCIWWCLYILERQLCTGK